MPSGWPSAIAPPFGLTCSASSGRPSSRSTASDWAAKASLSSMTSKSSIVSRVAAQKRLGGRHRPDAHEPGCTPALAPPRRAPAARARSARRLLAEANRTAAAPSLTPEALPAVTVPGSRNGVGSASSLSIVCRARMLVALDDDGSPPGAAAPRPGRSPARADRCDRARGCAPASAARRHPDRRARCRTPPRRSRPSPASSRCRRDCRGRIDEPPPDRRVVDLGLAGEGAFGLGDDERRAAHALDAPGDHHVRLARAYLPRPDQRSRRAPDRTGG